MKKRLLGIALLSVLLLGLCSSALAIYAPRYTETTECSVYLTISNGTARCALDVIAMNSTSTINGTLTLKKDGLFWDTTIEEWGVSGIGCASIAKVVSGLKSGNYILTADVQVAGEEITKSAEVEW